MTATMAAADPVLGRPPAEGASPGGRARPRLALAGDGDGVGSYVTVARRVLVAGDGPAVRDPFRVHRSVGGGEGLDVVRSNGERTSSRRARHGGELRARVDRRARTAGAAPDRCGACGGHGGSRACRGLRPQRDSIAAGGRGAVAGDLAGGGPGRG